MKKCNSVISTDQRKPARPWPSSFSHDNRLHRCFFPFPSSDFCLHDEHQLVIIVFILNMGSKKCVINTRCDYHSCHGLDVMWLHKPPTVSLLPLDNPHSWLKMVKRRNTCWKWDKCSAEGALIKQSFSFSLCVFEVSLGEYLRRFGNRVADITSDHRTDYNVGFWLLTTSSADIQWSWKLEIQSMSKKKRKRFKNHVDLSTVCVMAPLGMHIFHRNKPGDIKLKQKSWHHQWSHRSLLDLTLHFSI